MNEKQRTEYELLKLISNELDNRLTILNKYSKEPNIHTLTFNFLLGSKVELLDFKAYINLKLAEYRKTIFKPKKIQQNEQA